MAALVLHVLLAPAPQTVEDVFLVKLHSNHHAVRHTLGAGIVVLDVGNVAHRVAHLEVDLVRTTKHVVEHFLQLGFDLSRLIAHFNKYVTIVGSMGRDADHTNGKQHDRPATL